MVSYKEYLKGLGLTEEEIESKLLELDEEEKSINYIKNWTDLDKKTINGYRFAIVGRSECLIKISKIFKGEERMVATFGLNVQDTIMIEMYLVGLGINIMVEERIFSYEERI